MQQQVNMQQTQTKRDSKAVTPPTTIETTLVSGGPLVGEKDGLVTTDEVKIDTPVGTAENK